MNKRDELKPGAVIPAGTLVLITQGEYSDYEIIGLFRATADTTVPGLAARPTSDSPFPVVDLARLTVLLEEVPHLEAWNSGY